MSTYKKKTKKNVTVVNNTVVWVPGEPLPKLLQDEVERQVEDFNRREEEKANEQLTRFCGPKHMNVTEVLFSVISFLTTRDLPLTLSKRYDCAPIAALLDEIVKANDFPSCREGDEWPKMVFPDTLQNYTNVPTSTFKTVYNVEQVYGIALPLIQALDFEGQNRLIVSLIKQLHEDREDELNQKNVELEEARVAADAVTASMKDLTAMLSGNVQLVERVRTKLPQPDHHG